MSRGRSQAEGLRDLVESLKQSRDNAKQLFLLQKLEPFLTMLSDANQPIKVKEVDLIGERGGQSNLSLATLLMQFLDSTGLRLPVSDPKRGLSATADSIEIAAELSTLHVPSDTPDLQA